MSIEQQIINYIDSLPNPKRGELHDLHSLMLQLMPDSQLWFLDGKNADNKQVTNPNIGYGEHTIKYANGTERVFYKIGMSANTTGISIYIMGVEDKKYLHLTYGDSIGKVKITSYCINFKSLEHINLDVLTTLIKEVVAAMV